MRGLLYKSEVSGMLLSQCIVELVCCYGSVGLLLWRSCYFMVGCYGRVGLLIWWSCYVMVGCCGRAGLSCRAGVMLW